MSEDSDVPESKQAPPAEGPCLTVWAGLSSDGILGPYIFSGDATISIYQLFLSKFVYELQQIYRYQPELHKPIFIHDDSEIHNCFNEFLDKEFPNHWIGPGSQYSSWPRLSPDLNPLCFFLWAHIKNQVFERLIVPGDNALIYRIHEAFISITPEMLKQALKDYQDRLNTVFERNGDLVDVHYDKESQEINERFNRLEKKALI